MGDKIDIHNIENKWNIALNNLREDNSIIPENKKLILNFLEDCELGKTIKNKAKKKVGKHRLSKYLSIMRNLSISFKKPFMEVNQENIEKFIKELEESDYSEATQVDYKKAMKKFWKWLKGNNSFFPDEVSWFDTSIKVKEIPALSKEEIERLIQATPTARGKALVMVMFDSGARIEEFLNIKIKHLTQKEDYWQIRIEFSKTKPRTISLPLSTLLLNNWLKEHPKRDDLEAQLFPLEYGAVKMFLKRLGIRVLKKKVYPHLLRHSSATYYCTKLNQYQLCYRYGWSMSSSQPARYIDRQGLNEEKTAELVKFDEITKYKVDNERLNLDMKLMKERTEKIEALLKKVIQKAILEGEMNESKNFCMSESRGFRQGNK